MTAHEEDWAPLDVALNRHLVAKPADIDTWLLEQTLLTAQERRRLIDTIPIAIGSTVLDVGTGFGALALELARRQGVRVIGVDRDERALNVARDVASELREWLHEGADASFEVCDVFTLPNDVTRFAPDVISKDNPGFDVAILRLVLQHVQNPQSAVDAVGQVVRHGGFIWVFDVDDGLGICWPPPSAASDELEQAFKKWQSSYGGDREIGRKIPDLLVNSGFVVRAVHTIPSASWGTSKPGDLSRIAAARRISSAAQEMIRGGFIGEDRCNELLNVIMNEPPRARFQAESQIITIAQKPL